MLGRQRQMCAAANLFSLPGEPESLKCKPFIHSHYKQASVGSTCTEQSRLVELRVRLSTMPGVS